MNRTITTLALLTTNYKEKKEYIDIFIPFLAELFKKNQYKQIQLELENIIQDFHSCFGLLIPRNVLMTLLNRSVKKGLLIKKNNLYSINDKNLNKFYNETQKSQIEQDIHEILYNIKCYIKQKFNTEITEDMIADSLLNILKKYDADILLAVSYKSVIPTNEYKEKKIEYMVYSYILDAEQNKSNDIEYIIEIVTGHILAETILLSNYDSIKSKMKNITIYLDTPLIIELLGYSSEFRTLATRELIELLQEQSARICIFKITLDELKNIIFNCYERLDQNNFDIEKSSMLLKYCIDKSINSIEIYNLYTQINDKLKEYKIEIIDGPEFITNPDNVIDEKKLEDTIKNTYLDLSPSSNVKQETINTDVKVLSCIYFLTKHIRPKHIGECKHILVTSNYGLSLACKKFESNEYTVTQFIPACVTAVFIGTLLWLQSPQKVNNLNKLKFIGDCYNAIQPNNEYIEKFTAEINYLINNHRIPTSDITAIRSLNFIKSFHHSSYGDDNLIQADNIQDLFNHYKDDLINNATKPMIDKLKMYEDKLETAHISNKQKQHKINQINKNNIKKCIKTAKYISLLVSLIYIILLSIGIYQIFNLYASTTNLYDSLNFSNIAGAIVTLISYVGIIYITKKIYKKLKICIFFKLYKKQ